MTAIPKLRDLDAAGFNPFLDGQLMALNLHALTPQRLELIKRNVSAAQRMGVPCLYLTLMSFTNAGLC